MKGSAVFGLCGGVLFSLAWMYAPHPLGPIMIWTAMAAYMSWAATICWRRMRLPFVTTAGALGATVFVAFALLAASGREFPNLPLAWWLLGAVAFAGVPLFLVVESRVHPAEWQQWAAYLERKSAWEIFTLRHIPNLRGFCR